LQQTQRKGAEGAHGRGASQLERCQAKKRQQQKASQIRMQIFKFFLQFQPGALEAKSKVPFSRKKKVNFSTR